ncbi:MAG: metallophosphoesterase family protein [Planctomycetes bacterium]|nr:metallophosphoesterase family protein [Planctomycetota bacterium]
MGLLVAFAIIFGLFNTPTAWAVPNIVRSPYLQNGTPDGVTIMWRTDENATSKVWYGTSFGTLDQSVTDSELKTDHTIQISGLNPATKYYYQVGTADETVLAGGDEDHYFVTSPVIGSSGPIRIWVLGDSGRANDNARAVKNAYLELAGNESREADIWLMLGDNAYNRGTDTEYQNAVFNVYPEILRNKVLWATRGNHENSATVYYGIFDFPANGESGGLASGTEHYYSFDYANIHFICLNSQERDLSELPGSAMYQWLEEDLADTQQKWIIAFWHHPPYSKGSHDSDTESPLIFMRQNALPILEAGGVDLVLSGHSHSYERSLFLNGHYADSSSFDPDVHVVQAGSGREDGDGAYVKFGDDGTVYIVAGSSSQRGGGSMDHPVMYFGERQLGSLIIDVQGGRMDARFLREFTNPTRVDDYFTIQDTSPTARLVGPANGRTNVSPRGVVLGWIPGEYASKHDVYFGTNFDDVNEATGTVDPGGVYLAHQESNFYPISGALDLEQTYYWRVDEVNAPPDSTVYPGEVWSFTTEPVGYPLDGVNISATASGSFGASLPENTINGSGLVGDLHGSAAGDMWISGGLPATIEYAFDRLYKLHEVWIWNANQLIEAFVGFGAKDVVIEYSADGENWSILEGAGPLAQAPGLDGSAHDNVVHFGGAVAQRVRVTVNSVHGIARQASLSEVRFYYIPVRPREPQPESGAADVAHDVTLSWGRDGREAGSHDVYLGTDANDLSLAGSVSESSFGTLAVDLQLNQTYYWRVDEVNDAREPLTWTGDVWSFTTVDAIVIDAMERYKDEEFLEIWATWIDGSHDPANNGALVGTNPEIGDFSPETGIVHAGGRSLPIHYDNSAAAQSEATRTFVVPQDWTRAGVTTLVVWFHGAAGNTGQLYLKVNGIKIPFDGPAGNIALAAWQPWSIDLASLGMNLQSVRSLAVGIEGNGATGTLYVDDITLGQSAAEPINEWRVSTGSDDAEEHILDGGVMASLDSSDLELGYEGNMAPANLQTIGCRWVGIAVPKGATITEAWVQFSADDVNNDRHIPDVSVIIEGELSANPATFSSTASDISTRSTTTASVVWDIPQWMTVHAQGPEERTPDLSSILQEIVNQPGWAGDAIVLLFRDNPAKPSQGTREAESFNGDASEAPLLHISYQY